MRVVDFAIATHAGRVRRKNEDAYYAEPPLFAVADGMGGALAGELASRITVQTLAELVEDGSDEERLAATVRLANRRVAEQRDRPTRARRAWARPSRRRSSGRASVAFAHVGDSRAYLWRGGVADAPLGRPLAGRRVGARRARWRPRRPRCTRSAR